MTGRVLALILVLAAASAYSIPTTTFIDALLKREMPAQNIPGLTVSVMEGPGRYWSKGYGLADIENGVVAEPLTIYRLASISKSITATAVMQLAEREKLNLDSPIQTYCPAFPLKPWSVSARQLLGHLAGVRHYNDAESKQSSTTRYTDIITPLALFKNDPLLHEPGTNFYYTTYGYNVLGCAVEVRVLTQFDGNLVVS